MEGTLGTCCKCGKGIKPFARAEKDWLCKKCFYGTLWRAPRQSTPRHNGTRIPTPYEREQQEKWKDDIHEKINRGNALKLKTK